VHKAYFCGLAVAVSLFGASAQADNYVGAGAGVLRSNGAAFHIASNVFFENVEAHYTIWDDTKTLHGVGAGYRFEWTYPVSLVLGAAYLNKDAPHTQHQGVGYIELRFGPFWKNYSCQISHYSSVGDDSGENFLLCGFQWK
jgi:hypothetical protein